MAVATIQTDFQLPCGVTLKNRLCKAAMTEGLADNRGFATDGHLRLYDLWSRSGVGLLITGNVMVDRFHLERAGNVVIDGPQSDERMAALRQYAAAAQQHGTHCFVQLSHSGRQTPKNINAKPKSASDIQLDIPGGQYAKPDALSEAEIEAIIGKFSLAAKACQESGFSGVQIHGAHGYLLSQFLSPKSNRRTDRWGGDLENRARLLMEIVAEVRYVVGEEFPISVKLNSADFQRGGFAFDDCLQVIKWLNKLGIDLLEISGGNYEQPKMVGLDGALEPIYEDAAQIKASTKAREAYFIKYAAAIQQVAEMPLMVTGGFRSSCAMNEALADGDADMIGIGAPMVPYPHCTKLLLAGDIDKIPTADDFIPTSKLLSLDSRFNMIKLAQGWGVMSWYYRQLHRIGNGKMPDLKLGLFGALISHFNTDSKLAKAYKRVLK